MGGGTPEYSIYIHSRDGGQTWSSPTIVSYPSTGNSQLTVGADGQGGSGVLEHAVSSTAASNAETFQGMRCGRAGGGRADDASGGVR